MKSKLKWVILSVAGILLCLLLLLWFAPEHPGGAGYLGFGHSVPGDIHMRVNEWHWRVAFPITQWQRRRLQRSLYGACPAIAEFYQAVRGRPQWRIYGQNGLGRYYTHHAILYQRYILTLVVPFRQSALRLGVAEHSTPSVTISEIEAIHEGPDNHACPTFPDSKTVRYSNGLREHCLSLSTNTATLNLKDWALIKDNLSDCVALGHPLVTNAPLPVISIESPA